MSLESVRAACSANRDVPDCAPGPDQDCRDVIHLTLFFDGTGNNKDEDKKTKKWSNIANLYEAANRAALLNKGRTIYPIYISGVGTPFNGTAADWLAKAAAWVEDGFLGGGSGAGGDRRMNYGSHIVNDDLRGVLIANAKALGGILGKYAAENGKKSFDDVNATLARHRLIKVINVSIFGFSRGAALARAFSNRLIAKCAKQGGQLLYQSYPIRLNFMGLFDTVASFGVPAENVRTPFTERDLIVSPVVERCVHYVAAHEVRFSFPVDLIRKNGKLSGNWLEKTYPGVHADVGGGYEPMEQGIDNNYTRLPLREMMDESLSSGVRMLSYEDIKNRYRSLFEEQFECRPETEAAYARYEAACGAIGETVEQQIVAHMKVFYSANGTMYRRGIETTSERSRNASKYKYLIGSKGMANEVAVYMQVRKLEKWVRFSDSASKGFAQYIKIHDWKLAAWELNATDGVVEFMSRYVHDSKVDFLGNAEPFSYFMGRGVNEPSMSIWEEVGNWVRMKAITAGKTASQAVETARKML
jgi:uncharacterized protein (DUF2235 family)